MGYDIIVCGVGGQGVIFTSKVLSVAAMNAGFDVKKTDTLGMAQRGGSVVSMLRIGEVVHSPKIFTNNADFLIGLEPLECLRNSPFLSESGYGVSDTFTLKIDEYPKKEILFKNLKEKGINLINAYDKSVDLGNPLIKNSILLGHISTKLPFEKKYVKKAIEKISGSKSKINIKGFDEGTWMETLK